MDLGPGDIVGNRFAIEREAGRGGMGTVYRAADRQTGHVVAVKAMQNAQERSAERFAAEAQILSELTHDAVVRFVAQGTLPTGGGYLAMEWLEGEDLADRLARGPLPIDEAVALASRLAGGLELAHGKGVLHRDLKPRNVFLVDGDVRQAKLLDFGVAHRFGASTHITRTGTLVGTPAYMAPEQARGSRDLTAAADVFSLGCLLYECLGGEPPFIADHVPAVLIRVLFENPIPLPRLRPDIDPALNEVVESLLAKDVTRRVASARGVIEALQALPVGARTGGAGVVAAGRAATRTLGASGEVRLEPAHHAPEHALFSLVIASRKAAAGASPEPLPEGLLPMLRDLQVHADVLLDGSLAVRVPPLGSATDQASVAARVALVVREHLPHARIVVATGRGAVLAGHTTGEVIDRAARLLDSVEQSGSHAIPGIVLDEVSSGLLSARFAIERDEAVGFVLRGEQQNDGAARSVLGRPTTCVGRERELAMLDGTLAACIDESMARALLLVAAPGGGKSRLREELLRRVAARGDPPLVLHGQGDPMKLRRAYGLVGEALRTWAAADAMATLPEQRERLAAQVREVVHVDHVERVVEFIAELSGFPLAQELESPALRAARQDPRIMTEHVESAFLDLLRALSERTGILVILEDLHWCDALSVRLVGAALRALRDSPLMVLALARPEVHGLYPDLWSGVVETMPLQSLPRRAAERLANEVLGREASPDVVARIVDQAAGNPLFLEELLRAQSQGRGTALPDTILAMLQARIGRLGAEARRALRIASVLGETFGETDLRRVAAELGDASAHASLAELVREEMVEVRRDRGTRTDDRELQFRHALVRDAAYGLLGTGEARALHAAAGLVLEARGDRDPFEVAEHHRLGGAMGPAVVAYARAAEAAAEAGDAQAAAAYAERGLDCGAEGAARWELVSIRVMSAFWQERWDLVLELGLDAIDRVEPSSKAWGRLLEAVLPAVVLGRPALLLSMMARLDVSVRPEARVSYVRAITWLYVALAAAGQRALADPLRERLDQLAKDLLPRDLDARGYIDGAVAAYFEVIESRPSRSARLHHQAADNFREAGNHRLRAIVMAYEGKALGDLGAREEAVRVLRASLHLAEQKRDPLPQSYARAYLARLLSGSGDAAEREEATRLASGVVDCPILPVRGIAYGALARAAWGAGDGEAAERDLRTACDILAPFLPYRLDLTALLAEILAARGAREEARAVCEAAAKGAADARFVSYGYVALMVALAEARAAAGEADGAAEALARGRAACARWLEDITDPVAADTFARLPENAKLLAD